MSLHAYLIISPSERRENALCVQKASKSGFLLLTWTSELCWFCCTYCASVLATSAAAMTNSIDAIITQVQKEEIDPNGQYIGRAVLEDSCSEVMYATPTTARIDCSGETCAGMWLP
uniref:Phospholipid scramblase n=1 Tax=Ascaris lumbricoides TaxID=6252 RepID=A0A0M3I271_ASCLU